MRTTHRIGTVVVAAGLAAGLLAPTAATATTGHCTAWSTVPAKVSLHSTEVVVHPVLAGTAACHGQPTDNGATATLYPPKGTAEDMRWRAFGSSETVKLYLNLVRIGRYSMRNGDVEVYGSDYRQVPSSWRSTAMIVKYAGRFRHVSVGGGVVSGQAQHYTKYGWAGFGGKAVSVQRRAVGSSTWHTLATVHANSHGVVSYRTATSSRYEYQLASAATASVWASHSAAVRG